MSNKPGYSPVHKRPEWIALREHRKHLSSVYMRDLFANDPQRFEKFSLHIPGLLLDYSKHKITDPVMADLVDLARACNVEEMRDYMFNGEAVNVSEGRAVLHTALRGSCRDALEIDGENVAGFVADTLKRMQTIVKRIRDDQHITHVVNIGIGGSDLGPRMAYKALRPFEDGPHVSFLSNIDGSALHQRLLGLKPEHTLFIISSKSFSTAETLSNARAAKEWLLQHLPPDALDKHMLAVTANSAAARDFGITTENILPMRPWIGGRYSLWSAVGLPIAIACGFAHFRALLDGAHAMDTHFKTAPLAQNMPVILALLGIWYRNFWDYPAQAILPYSHDLRELPIYMQQLDMESNGKGVDIDGHALGVQSGPVVFGEAGTNAQHTFMQLLHQSPEIIPADFIMTASVNHPYDHHHKQLLAHALAQSQALMEGRENKTEPHRNFPGNRPSSSIVLDTLDAYHLGMLLALYEHKIFVQGIIWGINSFDQWGVELGKTHAGALIDCFENGKKIHGVDASTAGLLAYLQEKFIKS